MTPMVREGNWARVSLRELRRSATPGRISDDREARPRNASAQPARARDQ